VFEHHHPPTVGRFLDNLKRSVQFLEEFHIIDYSLLVGIHFRDRKNPAPLPGENDLSCPYQLKDNGILALPEAGEVYYVGIIDFLIEYKGEEPPRRDSS
jgi:hypothetical protein